MPFISRLPLLSLFHPRPRNQSSEALYASVAKKQQEIDDNVTKKQQEIDDNVAKKQQKIDDYIAKEEQEIKDGVAKKKQEIKDFFDEATVTQSLTCDEDVVVKLAVTTGTPSDSKSGMGPTILFAPVGDGNWAQASITPLTLPGNNRDDVFSVALPGHFRSGVKGFTIEATSIDGWLISGLSIQIGDGPVKILDLGDDGVWLDSPPYNDATNNNLYLGFPYHNLWTFEDLNAFPTETEMTGKSDVITVLPDFKKMSGPN
jgi:hypothetical protein